MAEEKKDFPTMERDFSKVILTLDNVLIPDERLETTPSMQDGLDKDIEQDLRILGCELIQTAGILLKLPQVAMAAGQVIFQRFYYSKSFVKHNMEVVAMASINLASKIEECPRRMRDVINVFHHVKQIKSGKTISPLILDQNYINLKNQVIKAERRLLKELGFCVHVKHPHKIIVMYLTVLECERNTTLVQRAWNYMNDSFRTNVFMRYRPEAIACACIFLASRELQVPLPNNPAWYEIFDVGQAQVEDICITLLKLYARKKPNPEELEKVVNEVKKIHIEAKLKAKGMRSAGTTPNSSSRPVSPAVKFGQSPAASKTGRSEDEKSDESAGSKENHLKKKRSYSQSPVNSRSRSRSRSRSYHSSSRSSSGSPSQKHRHRSPRKKHKKNSYLKEKHYKERHRKRSVSRSRSHSPDKRRYAHKKHYKERSRYRSRSRSRSPERYRPNKKHSSNGHRYSRSRSRERYRR